MLERNLCSGVCGNLCDLGTTNRQASVYSALGMLKRRVTVHRGYIGLTCSTGPIRFDLNGINQWTPLNAKEHTP
jgi:hypothetical protein